MKFENFLGGFAVCSVVITHLLSVYPILTSAIRLQFPDDNWWVVYFITLVGIVIFWLIIEQMGEDSAELVRLRRKCNEPRSTSEALRWELEDENRQRYEQRKLENGERQ